MTPQKPHCDPLYEPSVFNHPKKSIKKDLANRHKDLHFRKLILALQQKAKYRSKIKDDQETYEAYLSIKDVDHDKLLDDYIDHQIEENKYSKNFRNYLIDYMSIVEDETTEPLLGLG